MSKLIPLTQGQFAIVDDEDFDWLNQYKWYAQRKENPRRYYAVRARLIDGKIKRFFMHREIISAPKGVLVDHRDQAATLDNRRFNIRAATNTQNQQNRRVMKNNKAGFKGVFWLAAKRRWTARIQHTSGKQYLGVFCDKKEAARAYDEAALKYFGEFAYLNFPQEQSHG